MASRCRWWASSSGFRCAEQHRERAGSKLAVLRLRCHKTKPEAAPALAHGFVVVWITGVVQLDVHACPGQCAGRPVLRARLEPARVVQRAGAQHYDVLLTRLREHSGSTLPAEADE